MEHKYKIFVLVNTFLKIDSIERERLLKSIHIEEHFEKLYRQREEMLQELAYFAGVEWNRPQKDKWSWGETYYHLYLMVKWFRRLSMFYLPISKPVAMLKKDKPYSTGSTNVYEAYQDKNKKAMKAPFIIVPPDRKKISIEFDDLVAELDKETKLLEAIVEDVNDDTAGHIRFVDPLANHPNLIQSIDLLGIHEQHHFLLCKKYYQLGE